VWFSLAPSAASLRAGAIFAFIMPAPYRPVTHHAFHHVEAVELSLEIDRRRVFRYFGTESGYLLRLFALRGENTSSAKW
jgi:hypothetical protein